ncbi:MAG: chromosomal replication initiator protein DnaA [Spirochaetales bacterium]|nr:chromosomal replication initiator protein DnaA [Spirochaetales bacterium]
MENQKTGGPSEDYTDLWKQTMGAFKKELTKEEWDMWFSKLDYLGSKEKAIVIQVPSKFFQASIKQRYQKRLLAKIEEFSGLRLELEYAIQENPGKTGSEEEATAPPDKKTPPESDDSSRRACGLNPAYTFNQYIIGENNSFAVNAALAIAKNPGKAYNPCLIYGGVGLGKTHLIQAIGNAAFESNRRLKIFYVSSETFMNEFIESIRAKSTTRFKNKYRSMDMLLIDDIQFLENKEGTQNELFHTFNALYGLNKQIVFTSDKPVNQLKNLEERLQSRFGQGLNTDLQPPNYETRVAILKQKQLTLANPVTDEVIAYICRNITSNVRDLESALINLLAYGELVKKEITLEIAMEKLKDHVISQRQGNISVDLITRAVADYFNMSVGDIKGKRRNKAIVIPRQIAIYLARELTEYSTTEIGLEFGGRDHTTVSHACQKIENYMKVNSTIEPTIRSLMSAIQKQNKGGS